MSQLLYSAIPSFTDVLNSTLVRDAPLTTGVIKAIHHNALFAAVRCEWFDQGYYTDGNTIPLPVSPVDGYAYSRGELLYVPIMGSSRQPATFANAPIVPAAGLIRDANGVVSVSLSSPMSVTFFVGMPVEITGGEWIASTAYVGGDTIGDPNGNVQVVITPGTSGSSQPGWSRSFGGSTNDGGVVWSNQGGSSFFGVYLISSFASQSSFTYQQSPSLGPATSGGGFVWAQFRPGQTNWPMLADSDVGTGNLTEFPYQLTVDPTTGVLTAHYLFSGSGVTGGGTIHILTCAQRGLGTLTFSEGVQSFTDIPDSSFSGLNVLNQTKIRQLNSNAKFSAVRIEVFDSGYHVDGETVAIPTSTVDGYVYSRPELLHVPILASSRSPSSHTSGQLTFPTPAGGDSGSGVLLEVPRQLNINGSTGVITCKMFFAGSGITPQGTIRVITIAQRGSQQVQN